MSLTPKQAAQVAKLNSSTRFAVNYGIIAVLNAVFFALTIYGRYRLDLLNGANLLYTNWDALNLCLATACLNWVALLYGIVRRRRDEWLHCLTSITVWDQVFADGAIWILNLAAGAAQVAFINEKVYCKEKCDTLNQDSVNRNIAYAVFAWLLWAAWTPRLIWSSYCSRTA